jgi:hypothetical protein
MQAEMGGGNFDIYRSLYKEMSDELRREITAKPPAPIDGWTVQHTPGTGHVGFMKKSPGTTGSHVYAWAKVELADPEQMNEVLTFLNFYPIEACIVRRGHVCHFSVSYVEGNMHLRNVRIYKDATGQLAQFAADINYVRQNLRYDGPFIGHLEMYVLTELYDIMQDHGVDVNFLRYCGSWVAYLEHVEYIRWIRGFMRAVAPDTPITDETKLLSKEEKEELDTVAEEWLPAHNV